MQTMGRVRLQILKVCMLRAVLLDLTAGLHLLLAAYVQLDHKRQQQSIVKRPVYPARLAVQARAIMHSASVPCG